jgi:hypothetical protein
MSPYRGFSQALMKSFHYADVTFLILNRALLNLNAYGILFGEIAINRNYSLVLISLGIFL